MPFGSNFGSKTAVLADPLSGFGFWAWYFSNYLQLCNNRQDEHPIRQHYTRAQFWEQYLMFISLMDPVKEGKMGQAWDHETMKPAHNQAPLLGVSYFLGGRLTIWSCQRDVDNMCSCAISWSFDIWPASQHIALEQALYMHIYICIYVFLLFHFTQHPTTPTLWLNICIFPFK